MFCRPGDGLLYFRLFKSSQLAQAYTVAREIVVGRRKSLCHIAVPLPLLQEGYASGTCAVDSAQLDAAKSGVIYQVIAREKTVSAAATQAMLSHFRQVPLDQNRSPHNVFLKASKLISSTIGC